MAQEQTQRRAPSAEMLSGVDPDLHAQVLAPGDVDAALAMLEVVDRLPRFSSSVQSAAPWLREVRGIVQALGDACPESLEVRLLSAVASTAFAARETTPAQAASESALACAVDLGDPALQARILAQRLPFLAHTSPVQATRDFRTLDALLAQLPPGDLAGFRDAEVALARIAWAGATGDLDRLRRELAAFGRLTLPQDDRLDFCAYATHAALAQLHLRTHQRAPAAQALLVAAQLADAYGARPELANLHTCIAALAVQAGDFRAAVVQASAAVAAGGTALHTQPDPWLGMPFDVGRARTTGDVVQVLAEAILHAQDLGDATGFFQAATAMAAFYLADQRAMEALDALNEASEAAHSLNDTSVSPALRQIAEALLRHLGILKS